VTPAPTSPDSDARPSIGRRHLAYVWRLASREPASVDLAVVHCTELPDLATARVYGEKIHYAKTATGNSGHFYIDRDGVIEEWAPIERVAHHVRSYNERSVGIELVNRGRFPDWYDSRAQTFEEPYSSEQIAALLNLLTWLKAVSPALKWIAGHDQLDQSLVQASDDPGKNVRRKLDPGPLFPWPQVLKQSGLIRFRDSENA
jgi:N-acetylmuramoyl-L-alanine amidase